MQVLVDENIPRMTVLRLRELGHDIRDLREMPGRGMADSELWSLALTEHRLLITTDRGFAQFRTEPHHGIVIIACASQIATRYIVRS